MATDAKKTLIHRLFHDVVNAWNVDLVGDIFAPSFHVDPDQPSEYSGPDDARRFFRWLRSAFPDLHYTIEDLVSDGDKIVARVSADGTHQGTYCGYAATGRRVSFNEMMMFRIEDELIAEWWVFVDRLTIFDQIRAVGTNEGHRARIRLRRRRDSRTPMRIEPGRSNSERSPASS